MPATPDTSDDRADRPAPLISVDELRRRLAGEQPPAVLDVRWTLAGGPGRADHAAGHLPGAVFVDLDVDLSGPRTPGAGRHPLPDPVSLQETVRRWGVEPDRPVVVYDAADGTSAARAWWILRWAGHPDVRLLDGGYRAWTAAGGEVSTDAPAPVPGSFRVRVGAMPTVDADGAAALAVDGVLLDARGADRYRGEHEPVDPVAGHIPGAVSAPTWDNVGPDGRFLDADELRRRFERLGVGDAPVGAYCGSGITAAHEVLALEVAGVRAALYPASWSGWIEDPDRPVATGPQPT